MLATFMPLVSVVVSLTLGVWGLARIGAVAMVQAGFAAGLAFAALLWLVWGQTVPMVIASFCFAAALGIVQAASFATIPQLNPTPDGRARAAGAIAQLGNLGTTTGTPLLVWLISAAGGTGLSLFLAVFCALGIIVHAVQSRRRQT